MEDIRTRSESSLSRQIHQRRSSKMNDIYFICGIEPCIAMEYARRPFTLSKITTSFSSQRNIRQTMSRSKFSAFLKYLGFYDKSNLKPIRTNTSCFPNICTHVAVKLSVKFMLTVDELLGLLKPRCPFSRLMPKNPDKYGIKFWVLADIHSYVNLDLPGNVENVMV